MLDEENDLTIDLPQEVIERMFPLIELVDSKGRVVHVITEKDLMEMALKKMKEMKDDGKI